MNWVETKFWSAVETTYDLLLGSGTVEKKSLSSEEIDRRALCVVRELLDRVPDKSEGLKKWWMGQRRVLNLRKAAIKGSASYSDEQILSVIEVAVDGYAEHTWKPKDDVFFKSVKRTKKVFQKTIDKFLNNEECYDNVVQAKTEFCCHVDLYAKEANQSPLDTPRVNIPLEKGEYLPRVDDEIYALPDFMFKIPNARAGEYTSLSEVTWERAVLHAIPKHLHKLEEDALLQLFKELHVLLVGSSPSVVVEPAKPEFRRNVIFIDAKRQDEDIGFTLETLRRKPTPGPVREAGERHFEFHRRWGAPNDPASFLRRDDWEELKKSYYIPPLPKDLPQLTSAFLKQFIEYARDPHYSPEKVAAFLHYGISALQMFGVDDGRLARLVSNIYLIQNQRPPFIVFDYDEYIDLFEEENYADAFCMWLQENRKKLELDGLLDPSA